LCAEDRDDAAAALTAGIKFDEVDYAAVQKQLAEASAQLQLNEVN